ncbi:MAG: protein translocase SEC61 complex subunit gamma [Candidatus Thermoplasmatota archaeon]|jgi:protein transport protein SEC61 subunit gamma-like protein|nr:protein translocase SEC61 complex subunit gamma [Candidatus Thermoplasmatota archaeon]MCL5963055.1 protein translocase SEC61 complex subunit gamma [Candidatus Thermoplasmatota archaeon]
MKIIDNDFKKAQSWIEGHLRYIGKGKYGRVLRMARRPEKEEYRKVVMMTGLGILLLGVIGFIIYILMTLVAPYIASFIHF